MIKEEHIRQAIREISLRDQGIADSLEAMLSEGRIGAASSADGEGGFHFLFEGERVPVRRYLFFDHGTLPIEQGLLIKHGEFVKRKELGVASGPTGTREATGAIRQAGLRLAVTHEIDYATARVEGLLHASEPQGRQGESSPAFGPVSLLKELRADDRPFEMSEEVGRAPFVYRGVVSRDTPACFLPFPVRRETLMQVADLNLEYFSIRFILDCLTRGTIGRLMACVVGQRIVGLLYLELRKRFLKEALEIKFHATLRGTGERTTGTTLKGVGSFLVAGVWMVRANHLPHVKEIFLDSEAGARGFYESLGFAPQGFSGYILKEPRSFMLHNLLTMAAHCRDLRQDVIEDLENLVENQVKDLQKKARSERDRTDRDLKLDMVKRCLTADLDPAFARAAVAALLKYRKKIPESEALMALA